MFDRDRILRLAARHAERGNLELAAREYGKLAEVDPSELFALHRVADLEHRRGARVAVAQAYALIGDRLVARGWRLAAIYRYRRLLELGDTLPVEARARYRGVSEKVERLRVEVAKNRVKLSARDEATRAVERRGHDADLPELLGEMIALEPDNPVFHARLAETYCRLGRTEDALPVFRAAAHALIELERRSDAVRVLERILHFRIEPEDCLLAAELYLTRGDANDPVRAVAKLQPCLAADPESLDALGLLARAFDAMGQPSRAVQVRVELARVAEEAGEHELLRDLVSELARVAPEDPVVRALAGRGQPDAPRAPALSVRSSFASVMEADLVPLEDILAVERSHADSSVLDELSFEELSEVWVMPVVSPAARRAMDDAEAFVGLRLFPKAAYVLEIAVEEEPLCAELREALRAVLRSSGDLEGYVVETTALADLYRQRRFLDRARAVLAEALAVEPSSEPALALVRELSAQSGAAAS